MQRASDNDKTWIGFNTVVAGIAEGNIGIICACAPSIHHYFRRFFVAGTTIAGSRSTAHYPSFVTPNTASRSHPFPNSVSRTPQMAANRRQDDLDDNTPPAEVYEWHQKGQFSHIKSESL